MSKKYSELDKIKYVRAFNSCTLPMYDYARKMGIPGDEFREWLKEYKNLPAFGTIQLNVTQSKATPAELIPVKETVVAPVLTTEAKTIMNFNNGTIKLELKENFNKELLQTLVEALVKC